MYRGCPWQEYEWLGGPEGPTYVDMFVMAWFMVRVLCTPGLACFPPCNESVVISEVFANS